jgi:hypothetical protein
MKEATSPPPPLVDPVIFIETVVEVLRRREARMRSAGAQQKVACGGSSRERERKREKEKDRI